MRKILVTGSAGQIGSELTLALRNEYGSSNVVAGGHKNLPSAEFRDSGPFELVDCLDIHRIAAVVSKYAINTIYHMVSILSVTAEANPQLAWNVNMNSLVNLLEVAREQKCTVFVPSSIGAFGPSTPPDNTPQVTIQRPTSIYGVTKVSGELLCDYYCNKFAVDTRGLRYPGIISHITPPGGGTTDYAVEIFYKALLEKKYQCFLRQGTKLDMMYMPDAIKAAMDLMEADPAGLIHRNAYNISAMSFAPEEIFAEIKKHIPEFTMSYEVDPLRQGIADSWPNFMDDTAAKQEWGWKPDYDLPRMVTNMLENIVKKNP